MSYKEGSIFLGRFVVRLYCLGGISCELLCLWSSGIHYQVALCHLLIVIVAFSCSIFIYSFLAKEDDCNETIKFVQVIYKFC